MEKRTLRPGAGLLLIGLLVAGLGLALVAVRGATTPGRVPPIARSVLQNPYSPSGVEADLAITGLAQMEEFWSNRLSAPTGRFDPAWLLQAAAQDRLLARGVPAGQVIYNRTQSRSPLSLDPTRFTSLGPQPVSAFGQLWSGRVNAIAVDPVTPNVAYLAVNGGGVWKSRNCCTPAMTWAPATDDPAISIIGVDDIVIDPNNHNVVYAGTGDLNFTIPEYPSAGILKSTDQGTTWTVIGASALAPPYPEPPNTYPQDQAVGKVRVDPRNSNHLVAGTSTGVFFSYDAGANWAGPCYTDAFTSTQRQDTTGLLLRDNGSSTDIYVAVGTRAFSVTIHPVMAENGADGIYQTTLPSSGCPASWTLISRPNNGWPAGTGSGIPRYQGGNPVGRIDLAFAPSTIGPGSGNVTIYAQAQSAASLGQLGLWRTTDGGATWQQRSDVNALGGCGMDWPQNWFDQGLLVDPANPNTLYMDTFEVWRSTDGGVSFTDTTCSFAGGPVHADQHALAFMPGSSHTVLAGADGGSYLSTDDGTSWVDLNSSLSTLEFYSGDITGDFANAPDPGAIGSTQDNGTMVNVWTGTPGPAVWSLVLGGDGWWSRVEPVLGQRWYAEVIGSGFRHILMSSSGPFGSYQDISGSWAGLRGNFILPYELYKYDCPPTGCTHIIVGINRVDESLTGDGNWITVSPVFTSYITQLNYAVSLSTTAIIGLGNGQVQYGFGLGQGTMATWVNVTGNNAVLPNRPILDVATDPVNPLIGYAAVAGFDENTPSTPGHVFQVTCAANCASFTWANKSGNLPDIPVESITANPRFPQQVFAGSDWGLYYTNDITAASPIWLRFNAGLPNVMIYDMTIDQGFTTLALWTRSRGAFAWPLPAGPFGGTATPTATGTPPTATRTATPTATATCPVPAPNPWATVSPIPTAAEAVGVDGDGTYAYAAGGFAGANGPSTRFARYNPATNAWTTLSPLPDAADGPAVVYAPINNRVYVFGGDRSAAALNTTRYYDIAASTWATGAVMPGARTYFGGAYYNGKIYLAGGTTSISPAQGQAQLWEYDPVANTWNTSRAAMPQPRVGFGYGVVNGHFYVVSGEDITSTNQNTVYDYNIAANTWTTTANVPTPVYGAGSAVVNGRIWLFGGFTPTLDGPAQRSRQQGPAVPGVIRNLTQIYDPGANTWSSGPLLNAGRDLVGGAHVGSYIVAVGGYTGSGDTSTTEVSNNPAGACGTATPTASPTATLTPGGPTPCPIQFTDVSITDPFYTYIRCLACRQILSGYSTSPPCVPGGAPCFNGGASITRGQVAKIVVNAAGFSDAIPSTQQTFSDVPYGSPFWLYVERAALHNVISGYSTSPPCPAGLAPCFLPSTNVTRGQMAKIDTQAVGYSDPVPSTQQTFTDVPYGSPFWLYVERASLHGVISGYSSSPPCTTGVPCFLPGNNLTRNQAAKIVANTFYPSCQTPARR